ncbi:MAG: hypothetical protein JW940_14455 [Polyangiaceae bacterium]|nr:hypothetical protein [Polyangiaceae bacterium]
MRRMEGVELHPVEDGRGVHRFDREEVERAASAGAYRWRTSWQPLVDDNLAGARAKGVPVQDREPVPVPERGESGQDGNGGRQRGLEEALVAERSRRQDLERENSELRGLVAALASEIVQSLTPRQVRALREGGLEDLVALLGL